MEGLTEGRVVLTRNLLIPLNSPKLPLLPRH